MVAPTPTSSALAPGQALAACHLAVLLFGFAGLFGKWIAWDATAIVLGRTVVAAAMLAVVIRLREPRWPPLTAALVVNGVILAAHWTSFFAAIRISTVAIGLLGFASFPLFVPWLERLLRGVPVTRNKLAGAALVTLGLVLVVPELRWGSDAAHGFAWGIVSGFTFALLTVKSATLLTRHRATAIALWQNAIAALVLAPLVIARGAGGPVDLHAVVLVLVLGTACTAVAHTLYTASLSRISAQTAAVCVALEPVYGIALAFVLLQEVPGPRMLAGVALLVAAALVASWHARRVARSPGA